MRICLRYSAMGGPAGMGYARTPRQRLGIDFLHQKVDLADFPFAIYMVTVQDRNPGRIVAAVLQIPQPLYEYRQSFFFSYISDYAAHAGIIAFYYVRFTSPGPSINS